MRESVHSRPRLLPLSGRGRNYPPCWSRYKRVSAIPTCGATARCPSGQRSARASACVRKRQLRERFRRSRQAGGAYGNPRQIASETAVSTSPPPRIEHAAVLYRTHEYTNQRLVMVPCGSGHVRARVNDYCIASPGREVQGTRARQGTIYLFLLLYAQCTRG